MEKKTIFNGTATALITPFKNGEIDYTALEHIIELQIKSNIDALVIAGTTGEASTLSEYERYQLYERSASFAGGKVPLILGCGTNDTKKTCEYSKRAKEAGADALLIVTPYYNKGTEEGLLKHYLSAAECTDLPIILYNVPSRTSVNLSLDIIKKLAEHENIVAIKEASDSLDRQVSLSLLSDSLTIYSGNDTQIYTNLALGGGGVISVASNLIPKRIKKITDSYLEGDGKTALSEQKKLLPLILSLFTETNPSCIKYAMSLFGLCSSDMRLPLTEPCERSRKIIEEEIGKLNK